MKRFAYTIIFTIFAGCAANINLKKDATQNDRIFIGRWLRFEGNTGTQNKVSWLRYGGLAYTSCNGQLVSNIKVDVFAIDLQSGFFALKLPTPNVEKNEKFDALQIHCWFQFGQTTPPQHQWIKIVDLNKLGTQPGVYVLPTRRFTYSGWDRIDPTEIAIIEKGQENESIAIFKEKYPDYANFTFFEIHDDGFKNKQ